MGQETQKIKRLFLVAIALTLLVITADYVLLSRFMESQDHAAAMINISGRQRMLSQRTAMWAERLTDAKTTQERAEAREILRQTSEQMRTSHEMLVDPNSHIGAVTHSSSKLLEVYFNAPEYLDKQVRDYVAQTAQLLAESDAALSQENPHVRYLLTHSTGILHSFDKAVDLYQETNLSDLNLLHLSSVALFTVALVIMFGLWWVVFRPMLRSVNNAMQLMQLQQKVAVAANESTSIQNGLQVAVDSVSAYMHWPVGHVYLFSEEKNALVSMEDVWHLDDASRYDDFRRASDAMIFAPGQGFIGEVYGDATPMWILDVADSSVYLRKEVAQKAGLKAAFAFPIFVNRKAVAVMEFYATESTIPSETLLQVMANIGKQLGQTIERSQFEERARLLETVIQSANDGILITKANLDNPGPEIIYVNDAFARISGYSAEEVIGKSPRFLQNEFTKRETLDAMKIALEQGVPFKDELLNSTKNGEHYWLDISIVPVRNTQGVVTHFAAIERDITAKKQEEIKERNMWLQLKRANLKAEAAARDLQASLTKAEEANKAKGDFLANMSHELRTPMNGVLGMAQLLADTGLDEEQRELVTTINGSAENLLVLLNDILDFSKIEAGALVLEHIAFGFIDTLQQTVNLMKPQAEQRGIDLIADVYADVPPHVWGDPGRLRQIVVNLLGNAIKFTERGYVRLNARVQEDDHGTKLYVGIEDTGVGIPVNKIESIFEKFTQADASITRKYGGTGLGLAITKQLVNLMGGAIGVESAEGKGSTFWFTIPCERADKREVTVQREHQKIRCQAVETLLPIAQAKVLLVDDYPVNRVFAEKLLRKFGFTHIEVAENGLQALDLYRTKTYDIIFMDCQMPEMDGYQTTQKIRAFEEGTAIHTPIVAMTANAMMGDREKCLKSGMDEYLSKPLRVQHLQKVLEAWFVLEESLPGSSALSHQTRAEVEVPPVDLTQLRLFTDGDPAEEKALADLFLDQAWEMVKILENSMRNDQQDAWKSAAHRFKGSSGNLGAMKLHHLCKRAEMHATDNAGEKREMFEAIQAETRRVEQFFRVD